MSQRKRNRGFTMIELIVSMGLGLLVAAAATQLFLTNLQGFNTQRGMGDVQDNGRFALDFINRDVRQTGLSPEGQSEAAFVPVVAEVTAMPGAAGDLLTLDSQATPGLGRSDQLVIQRLIEASTVTCEGNLVEVDPDITPKPTRYLVSRYFLREDVATGATSALACDGGWHDGSTLHDVGDAGVVLLGSVENLQVQLGVGTSSVPTRYMRPDEYATLPLPRPQILVVRMGALVASADTTGGQVGAAPDLNVLDALVDDVPADGRIRRVFVTSIAIRNEL